MPTGCRCRSASWSVRQRDIVGRARGAAFASAPGTLVDAQDRSMMRRQFLAGAVASALAEGVAHPAIVRAASATTLELIAIRWSARS